MVFTNKHKGVFSLTVSLVSSPKRSVFALTTPTPATPTPVQSHTHGVDYYSLEGPALAPSCPDPIRMVVRLCVETNNAVVLQVSPELIVSMHRLFHTNSTRVFAAPHRLYFIV